VVSVGSHASPGRAEVERIGSRSRIVIGRDRFLCPVTEVYLVDGAMPRNEADHP
jgi:hypothetical protein